MSMQIPPVIIPQVGEDLRAWAMALVPQLQNVIAQSIAIKNAVEQNFPTIDHITTPIYNADGTEIINSAGYYIDGFGRVIVDENGLHVYDLVGFQIINGPNVQINTDQLVDNAVITSKLANGAITETKISDDSISTPKLQANAVVAGKIAANSIIANDGVIGALAIVDAMVANLSANKIHAGDIAAERMEANIVQALYGKFAQLDALAASLGVVRILPGGALLTEHAIAEMTGVGVWIAEDKLRVGDPTSTYFRYDGSKLLIKGDFEVRDTSNNLILAANGTGSINDEIANAQNAADAAQLAADNAQTNSNSALILLTEIASDSKLTPQEKHAVRLEWDVVFAEKAGIVASGTTFGLGALITPYNTAFQALATYLNNGVTWTSGVPSWLSDGNLATTQDIVGNTFRTKWKDYYDTRQNLLNAVAIETAKRAEWAQVTGAGKPEDNATVGAPVGTFVAGVPAASVATAATNYNAGNDRNSSSISAPTILTDGTAVDHTLQTDGSADISFEWSWSGTEADIDGFLVFVRQSTSNAAYTFGTTVAQETVFIIPANKRAFILYGVAADRYYTWGVQAYRSVDKDINATSLIKSSLVKATGSGENPYRPSANVAFAGDVTGTVNGIPATNVNVWENISGSGKPEDNATYGAIIGSTLQGVFNQTTWNNYISTVLIDKANIGSLFADVITGNKLIGDVLMNFNATGSQSILFKTGTLDIRANGDLTLRGDIRARSLEADTVMVQTAHIGGNAVTIPVSAEGVYSWDGSSPSKSTATTSSNDWGGQKVAIFVYGHGHGSGSIVGQRDIPLLLYRDTTVILDTTLAVSVAYPDDGTKWPEAHGTTIFVDTPTAGSHYYKAVISSSGSGAGTPAVSPFCRIVCIGLKR